MNLKPYVPKTARAADSSPSSEELKPAELLWTCGNCGADYDADDMAKVVVHAQRRGDGALECTVCHAVGQFVDGPDA